MTDRHITELLFVDDGPEPADLALVFGCVEPEESRQRALHAAALFHARLVPRLLLSGGVSHPDRPESEAGLMLRVVLDLGVPREAVLVEESSRTTFENVSSSATLLHELDLLGATRTILLVSCPWHMRRVSLIARADFPQHVRLWCCPHTESCTARTWASSLPCRDRVVAESVLLAAFIDAGILPDPSL